jgi:DNA-binding IclR family transcriptional regulator
VPRKSLTKQKRYRGRQPAGFARALGPLQRSRARAPAGIQSLETGIGLLRTLVSASGSMRLKDLAAASRMSASKAHRYMVSLCRSGLVAQEVGAAEYRLGPYAVEMAVACLNSIRPIKLASESLEAIGREIQLTVAIAAWGNHGPTIVRIEESLHAVSMNVRAGTVVPLSRSASGLVFAAFMPRHVVEPLLAAEVRRPEERRALAPDRCRQRDGQARAWRRCPRGAGVRPSRRHLGQPACGGQQRHVQRRPGWPPGADP